MKYASILAVCLFSFWLLLSGYWDHFLLILLGIFSSLFAAYIGFKIKQQNEFTLDLSFFLRLPQYTLWLIVQIWQANVDTAKRIWMPKTYPITPTLCHLKMSQSTTFGQTIYANSITITPGTVSIDIEDNQVFVHALSHLSIEDLQKGEMDSRVTRLENSS